MNKKLLQELIYQIEILIFQIIIFRNSSEYVFQLFSKYLFILKFLETVNLIKSQIFIFKIFKYFLIILI